MSRSFNIKNKDLERDGTVGTLGTPFFNDAENHFANAGVDVEFEELAAIIEFDGGAPRVWAEAYAGLCLMARPADWAADHWRGHIYAAGLFLDQWADQAVRLGWHPAELIGTKPHRLGLLAQLAGWPVIELAADRLVIKSPHTGCVMAISRAGSVDGRLAVLP